MTPLFLVLSIGGSDPSRPGAPSDANRHANGIGNFRFDAVWNPRAQGFQPVAVVNQNRIWGRAENVTFEVTVWGSRVTVRIRNTDLPTGATVYALASEGTNCDSVGLDNQGMPTVNIAP